MTRYMEQSSIEHTRRLYKAIARVKVPAAPNSPATSTRYHIERRWALRNAAWVRNRTGHRSEYYQQCLVGLRQGHYGKEM